ncbi:MAG TPA: four-carbon acid sugar kinase family protein [Terracidiphilus sp.]
MPQVLILADDLSGAADCGLACMRPGLDAEVVLGPSISPSRASILAVDADTRGLSPSEAANRMYGLASSFKESSTVLFKKIDSTLRGHVGVEILAVLAARRAFVPNAIAVMAPAFPANGRTTPGGVLYLHGRPLHETEMWKYEEMHGEANIAQMLQGSGLRCSHVDLAFVRKALSTDQPQCQDVDVVVCDAATDDDMLAIARLAAAFGERAIWVGSAGLSHFIPEAAHLVPYAVAQQPRPLRPARPSLFVIGTAAARTREQVALLLSSSQIHSVVVPPDILLQGGSESADWQKSATDLSSTLENGNDVILICDSEPVMQSADRGQISFALAEMTAALRNKVGTLVASGGETARQVLDRWNVGSLQLYGELELGVPISSASLGNSHTIAVITKAGDFGQPDTLLHCLHWIKEGGIRE